MLITVNTDASFSHRHRRGTYAFWIVCNEFKVMKSGVLKNKVMTSDEAETQCIINAMSALLFNRGGHLRGVSKIIVNTDSMNAIHVLTNNVEAMKKYYLTSWGKDLHDNFQAKVGDIVQVEFRHVRAHSGVGDARSYVNEWCDQNAKDEIRRLIRTIDTKKTL